MPHYDPKNAMVGKVQIPFLPNCIRLSVWATGPLRYGVKSITFVDIIGLAKMCPALQRLDIHDLQNIRTGNQNARPEERPKQAIHLRLERYYKMTDDEEEALRYLCHPWVESLYLSCRSVLSHWRLGSGDGLSRSLKRLHVEPTNGFYFTNNSSDGLCHLEELVCPSSAGLFDGTFMRLRILTILLPYQRRPPLDGHDPIMTPLTTAIASNLFPRLRTLRMVMPTAFNSEATDTLRACCSSRNIEIDFDFLLSIPA
jgi:hypothetical protein